MFTSIEKRSLNARDTELRRKGVSLRLVIGEVMKTE
jgi:hypothetical protein